MRSKHTVDVHGIGYKLKSIENPGYKVAMVMTTVMKIHRSSSEKLEYMECGDLSIQQERRRSRFV